MKERAAAGEIVRIQSGEEDFVFQGVRPNTWQNELNGKAKISGDPLQHRVGVGSLAITRLLESMRGAYLVANFQKLTSIRDFVVEHISFLATG